MNEIDETLLLFSFYLNDALFCIDTLQVQEVVNVGDITPVHHAPPYVVGICNLRGRIMTVMDLAIRFGMRASIIGPENRILVVEWQNEHIGLLVDRVAETLSTNKSEILPTPPNVQEDLGKYLNGAYRGTEGLMALFDPLAVLQSDEETGAPPTKEPSVS